MKQKKLLSFTLIAVTAILISSCGSSKPYSSSPDRYSRTYASLIITPSPGFKMNHYSDGRYYHRSPQGFMFWKGYDNRFFLDKKHVNKASYNKREYKEWKKWYEQRNKNNNRRHSY